MFKFSGCFARLFLDCCKTTLVAFFDMDARFFHSVLLSDWENLRQISFGEKMPPTRHTWHGSP